MCCWRQPSLNKQIGPGEEEWWVHESKASRKAPPFLLLCKLSHPDPNSARWRACCRGGAVNCPGPTSCPTCGAKCPCWRQPWAQEAMNWRCGCVTNAPTPCSCLLCRLHHVPGLAWDPFPPQPLPKAHAYHQAYKCTWSRGRTQQARTDNQSEYTARVFASCTGTKGNKILGCIKGTIPEDGKTNILIWGCGETSVSHSFDHHLPKRLIQTATWAEKSFLGWGGEWRTRILKSLSQFSKWTQRGR